MKLSVITINYNNSEGLEKTINSIINQSFSDFEYLVIDGGSTDGSVDVIKQYSHKINYSISEPDSGVYNAMNKGIVKAKGEYLLFINSGDTLYGDDVLSQVFRMNLDHDLIYGDLHRTFPDGSEDIVYTPNCISIKIMLIATLPHPITFIRKSLFFKYGLYREDLSIVSDWAFFLKLIAFTPTSQVHIPIVISSFSMDGLSTTQEGVVSKERYEVIQESFSPELNYICYTYDFYKDFYNKPIFFKFGQIKSFMKQWFTVGGWEKTFKKMRNPFFVWITNKTVRIQKKNPLEIPILIINYNRLSDLKKIVSFYKNRGHKKIVIIDNKSSYPPLLEYYDQIKDEVIIKIMDRNYGHRVFWENPVLYSEYSSGYYIITDPDVIPNDKLPKDFLTKMIRLLDTHSDITKVGFALRLDNIPACYPAKQSVLEWESKFWEISLDKDTYKADIDTTFAIYHPHYTFDLSNFTKGIRIAGDYLGTHTGWYIDPENMSDEDRFYFNFSNNSNSWKINAEGEFKGSSTYSHNK